MLIGAVVLTGARPDVSPKIFLCVFSSDSSIRRATCNKIDSSRSKYASYLSLLIVSDLQRDSFAVYRFHGTP